jgi:hypothetical protein
MSLDAETQGALNKGAKTIVLPQRDFSGGAE